MLFVLQENFCFVVVYFKNRITNPKPKKLQLEVTDTIGFQFEEYSAHELTDFTVKSPSCCKYWGRQNG